MLCSVCLTALLGLHAAHGGWLPVVLMVHMVGSLLELCMYVADQQSC